MYGRHRNPGNGYRSGSTGMGFGASRISPENSGRGRGFYNSEYRSFNNRGFGRGQGHPKSFEHPPQPPPLPRKGDIFVEAGRLAAEYLVSKGVLPQSALSGKWRNGSFKKQVGDYQDFRQQEELTNEGRTSVHARLGSGASDVGIGRRRYDDEFNSRNHVKGRRRGEYYRSYIPELANEYGRSGSWSDQSRVSPGIEGDDDFVSGQNEEQQGGRDVGDGMRKYGIRETELESGEAADTELELENYSYPDEMVSKAGSSSAMKDETDGERSDVSNNLPSLNGGSEEMKDNYEDEKQLTSGDSPAQCSLEGDLSRKSESDLLSLCKFANVPTKMRSALTNKASKVDPAPEDEGHNVEPPNESEVLVQDGTDVSTTEMHPLKIQDLEYPGHEICEVVPQRSDKDDKDVREAGSAYDAAQGKCVRSQSFPDRAFLHDDGQGTGEGLPGFGRSTSVKERGEKRAAEDLNMNEVTKKPREWFQSLATKANEHLDFSDLSDNKMNLQEERASIHQKAIAAVARDSLVDNCQFPSSSSEPCANYVQEKQLFPNSFKICDLNLMESSDMNDKHQSDPILMYPSIISIKKDAGQVDVDLSISNSNFSGECGRQMSDSKEIEVIDLENDSIPAHEAMNNPERRMETAFTGTEGFPSHAQNAGEVSDVQDNYDGLISEYLTSFSNCSSVAEDINPLQNEMGIHNGEGNLGDDDAIYMSLGEIPLSFIPAWEQPAPQNMRNPFDSAAL